MRHLRVNTRGTTRYKDAGLACVTSGKVQDVRLVPEPHNAHDPHAVRVEIGGAHVGYIPAEHAEAVSEWINEGVVKAIEVEAFGTIKQDPTVPYFRICISYQVPSKRSTAKHVAAFTAQILAAKDAPELIALATPIMVAIDAGEMREDGKQALRQVYATRLKELREEHTA